jgi:hypothetical protein
VKLDVGSGHTATMYTALSYMASHAICTRCEVEVDEDNPIVGYTTHLIPDAVDDYSEQLQASKAPVAKEQGVDFILSHWSPLIFEDDKDISVIDNPSAVFLCWHHKLNHMLAAKQDAGHGKTRR